MVEKFKKILSNCPIHLKTAISNHWRKYLKKFEFLLFYRFCYQYPLKNNLANDKASDHMEPLTEREKALATSIDDFFRHHMIDARNKR